jgi:hypothetical protein
MYPAILRLRQIEFILTYRLLPSPPDNRWSTAMLEGWFRLPGGGDAVWEQILIIENVAPFSGKIIICLQYLVLVLMRGSEYLNIKAW